MASTSSKSTRQAMTFFTAPEEASTSFMSAVEERIEHSKRHWSLLADSDCSFTEEEEAADNVEVFRSLQSHPSWGFFFQTFGYDLGVPGRRSSGTLEVGEKFAEGGQAELFHARVTWRDPEDNEYDREEGSEWVVKVFKKGTLLRHLQKQWPQEYLQYWAELLEQQRLGKPRGPRFCCQVYYGTLLEDGRFAFLMTKEEGDLRSMIERKMLERGHGYEGSPFPKEKAEEIMYRVALGMNWLHSLGVVHRDLKASNVLVNERANGYHFCNVADFECSVGVVGTGFFRAPEILQACKDGVTSNPELFTKAVDVYSYGMTCYEILTGKLPFQDHPLIGNNNHLLADHVINGLCPEVPNFVDDWALELLQRCWQSQPLARPSFGEILLLLEANSNSKYIREKIAERG